jgi:gas vesicle protein
MSNNKKGGKGKFVLGALIGAGLGILFAPKKGSETRKELKNKLDELISKAKDVNLDELRESLEVKIEEIRTELEELDREKVIKIAREKTELLKQKTDELVKIAVKKGTPVIKKAAEEVREKAILATKEILNRLENKQDK